MNALHNPRDVINQPTQAIVEAAANWHVQLHSVDATANDHAVFQEWLKEHPAHEETYKKLEDFWAQFNGVESKPAILALDSLFQSDNHNPKRKKLPVKSISLGIVIILTSWIGLKTETAGYIMADYSSKVGEQRVVELDDHSRITLNTYSAIDVDYTQNQRRIILRKGEVLVEVAKDHARPFIVETNDGTARALGTKFVVKHENNATAVGVIESVVEACTATSYFGNSQKQCVELHAGQGTHITDETIQQPMAIDAKAIASWANGMLSLDNRPLSEVLNELERYRHGKIYFKTSDLENMRVSGVFPLNDSDRALEVLAGIVPINVKYYSPFLIIVTPK